VTGLRQDSLVSQDFRQLMAGFPSGVAVVTAFDPMGRPWGMTCSSLCSVTLSPPTLLVCLGHGSRTLAAVRSAATFTVNLLHDQARATAELFASGDPHRFDLVRWHTPEGSGGPHLADATHAAADCLVSRINDVGDHAVVFGEVIRAIYHGEPNPLLYGLRRYAEWSRLTPVRGT
jgi:flavin reductase (NADH)